MIRSPDNDRLKTIRKLQQKRWREKLGLFAAEGEDLVDAAERAAWAPDFVLRAGEDVEPELLNAVSTLGSGSRVIGVYPRRWGNSLAPARASPRPRARRRRRAGVPARRGGPGERGRDRPLGPRARGRHGGARPRLRRPVLAQGRAGEHGLDLRPPARARDLRGGCRGTASRSTRNAGGTLAEVRLGDGPVVVCLGAEREGLPAEVLAAADAVARIPLRPGGPDSLNVAMAATVALYEVERRMRGHA